MLVSAAIVLVTAWLVGRSHMEAGVAVAVVGLAVTGARGALAVPVVLVLAAFAAAPVPVVVAAVSLGLIYGLGAITLSWGGAPPSGDPSPNRGGSPISDFHSGDGSVY
jgi:hypothetical protein